LTNSLPEQFLQDAARRAFSPDKSESPEQFAARLERNFDEVGKLLAAINAGAASGVYQPLDSDLTAISAIATVGYGRALLALADAAALRTYAGLVIGTNVQAYDATLTAFAAYNTNGLLTQTAADTFTGRTLTGDTEIVVANGSGVAGNPTLSIAAAIARLASPTFTGTPAAPTAAPGTNTTQLSTTAFVAAAIAALSSVYQPLDSDLTAIAALTTTSFGRSVLELANAAAGRTLFGLGTISTQDSNNVTITGGSITGITDLAVADGGTAASTASGARTNLGLVIGTDVAAIASPAFTGHPTGVTESAGDNSTRLASTAYSDRAATTAAAGLKTKESVHYATTAGLDAHTRLGNVLTASANGQFVVDGAVFVVPGLRILVKNEGSGTHLENGIYTCTAAGNPGAPWVLTRTTDADESSEVTTNLFVSVTLGDTNAGRAYYLSTADPITLNTTALTFTLWPAQDSRISTFGATLVDDTTAANARVTLDVPSTAEAVLDTIIDAKGDIVAGTAADTIARLAVGADDTILMADAAASTGLKWVASAAAGAIQPDDSAAVGTADTYARSDHKHSIVGAAASTLSGSNAEGSATSFARSDHNHALGGTVGGDLTGTLPNPTIPTSVISTYGRTLVDDPDAATARGTLGFSGTGTGDGTWTTWTPTLTNLTLGNGTKTGRYMQIGKTVHFRFSFKLGSTSAVGTAPSFSLPVTAAAAVSTEANSEPLGNVVFVDSAVSRYTGICVLSGTTDGLIYNLAVNGTYPTFNNVTATTPITWGTSDEITVTGTYEAA
jgi:hypothetical protein